MKTTGYLTNTAVAIFPFVFVTSGCNQSQNVNMNRLDAKLKMNESAWNDLYKTHERGKITTDDFNIYVTSLANRENVLDRPDCKITMKMSLINFRFSLYR